MFVHVYMQWVCMKKAFVCAGAISGIAVAGAVALVLFVLLILTLAFILHLKHRIRKQNRKFRWNDVVEEVDFIIQVRFDCIHNVGFDRGFDECVNVLYRKSKG